MLCKIEQFFCFYYKHYRQSIDIDTQKQFFSCYQYKSKKKSDFLFIIKEICLFVLLCENDCFKWKKRSNVFPVFVTQDKSICLCLNAKKHCCVMLYCDSHEA